jgi:hypothetical protein
MLLDVVGHADELILLAFGRDGDEDRLIEAAADQFDLGALDESAEEVEVFGMMALDPLEERAGIVQADADVGMAREDLDEREIGNAVVALEYVVEVPDRLVRVEDEEKMEVVHERAPRGRATS